MPFETSYQVFKSFILRKKKIKTNQRSLQNQLHKAQPLETQLNERDDQELVSHWTSWHD